MYTISIKDWTTPGGIGSDNIFYTVWSAVPNNEGQYTKDKLISEEPIR